MSEVSILENLVEDVTNDMPIALRKGKRSCSSVRKVGILPWDKGCILRIRGNLVIWRSNKKNVVARSSVKA
ncbi:hypothetical protein CR513_09081, partial [Mucuna pruriens]